MGLAVGSTASACRRIASLLVPEVPGAAGGASAGFDGAGAGCRTQAAWTGRRRISRGRACLRTALRRSRSRLLGGCGVLLRPEGLGGATGPGRRRVGSAGSARWRWRWFWGRSGFGLEGLWRHAVRGRFGLLEASPVVVGGFLVFCVGDGEGPVAGSFPMVMRSSPEGALVSDRRPGPGSGSRSTRLTAGGGVPGADRQGDRAMARRGRQGGLNAAPCFRRPRRGARRCAAAGRPVPG